MNPNNWLYAILRLGCGVNGALSNGVVPCRQTISMQKLARQLYLGRQHEHGKSHEGMALSGALSLMCPTLITVKHLFVGWARIVWALACTTLLCRLVQRLFMCLFVQHESKCRHVSFSRSGERLHSGEMSCLKACFLQ